MTVTTETLQFMTDQALFIRGFGAYAPYSEYTVGAVLFVRQLADSEVGSFFHGVNVENVSYGLTICAERAAIFAAVAALHADSIFDTMVIATRNGGISCGACLQVMLEFGPDMDLIFVNEEGHIVEHALVKDLLRSNFTKEDLNV
jgi:cytidine deaminase